MIRPLSDKEKAENWTACRKYLRRYFIFAMLPLLGLIWATGYAQGLLAGALEHCTTVTQRNTK